jgi:hypothetical protein
MIPQLSSMRQLVKAQAHDDRPPEPCYNWFLAAATTARGRRGANAMCVAVQSTHLFGMTKQQGLTSGAVEALPRSRIVPRLSILRTIVWPSTHIYPISLYYKNSRATSRSRCNSTKSTVFIDY